MKLKRHLTGGAMETDTHKTNKKENKRGKLLLSFYFFLADSDKSHVLLSQAAVAYGGAGLREHWDNDENGF